MFMRVNLGVICAAVLLVAGCAIGPAQFSNGVLTDAKGMTL
jgi:predicted lipoprotein with Yx(FWY)xxD motif